MTVIKGVPHKIVADRGTENVFIPGSQRFIRRNHEDDFAGQLSFLFGKSIANQRIEAFWPQFRRSYADWWTQFFKGLVLHGVYNKTDFLQVECFKFAFFPMKPHIFTIAKTGHYHGSFPAYFPKISGQSFGKII